MAYAQAMAQLSRHYPEDREGAIFYALALLMSLPPSDTTEANRLKAVAILEQVSSEQPDPPGMRLYRLQAYDTPTLAQRGLLLARQSVKLSDVGAYALHLPAHIFTRLGRWEEAVHAHLGAIASATEFAEGPSADIATSQRLPAMDALVYAYLQRGEGRAAQLVLDGLQAHPPIAVDDLMEAYAVGAMPARYALELARWSEAATLTRQPWPLGMMQFPQAEAVVLFAEALGAARSGDPERVWQALEQLETLHHTLILTGQEGWAGQVEIQQRTAAAWIARAEHKHDEAFQLMQAACLLEASYNPPPTMPGPLPPTRELLAELLLERGDHQQAQQAFETQLRMQPNRLNALYGAAHSAELAGDLATAASSYEDLLAQRGGDASGHVYFVQAQAFLANVHTER